MKTLKILVIPRDLDIFINDVCNLLVCPINDSLTQKNLN